MGDRDNTLKMGNCNDNAQCFDIRGGASSSTEVVNNIPVITSGNTAADPKARHISNRRGKDIIYPKDNPKTGKDDPTDKGLKLVGRHIHKEAILCGKINSYNAMLRMYQIFYPDLRPEYLYEEEVLSNLANNEDVSRVEQVPPSSNSSKKSAESDKKKDAASEASVPKKGEVTMGLLKDEASLENEIDIMRYLDEVEKAWTKKIAHVEEELEELKIGAANEYLKGFDSAMAQVRFLHPEMDLTPFSVSKIVSDGKLIDMPSRSNDGEEDTPTPRVDHVGDDVHDEEAKA